MKMIRTATAKDASRARPSARRIERVRTHTWVVPLCVTLVVYGHVMWFTYLWTMGGVDSLGSDFSQYKVWALEPVVGTASLIDLLTFTNCAALMLLIVSAWELWLARPLRRHFIAIALAAFVIGAYQYGVALHEEGAESYDNDRIRTEDELIAGFHDRRDTYEAHVTRVLSQARRLGPDATYWNVIPSDWRWFNEKRRELKADGGAYRTCVLDQAAGRVWYIATRNGIGTDSLTQGYVFMTTPSTRASAWTPETPSASHFEQFRHLRENWYLFRRRGY